MRITGVCSGRGCSVYSARISGATEKEKRLGVDFVAYRLDDGPIKLEPLRVLHRAAAPEVIESVKAVFLPHDVATIEVVRRRVGADEPLVEPGTLRWEFADSMFFSDADDDELSTIAAVMTNQVGERKRRDLILLDHPVTVQSFYRGIHSGHARTQDAVYDGTPNERSGGSSEKVDAAEQRLGVLLPARLRELFEYQNGGYVNSICIPAPGVDDPSDYRQIVQPFSGYDSIDPTEVLRSVHDSFLDFGDPDDDGYAKYFRNGVEKMIVLAKYYQETLFLDYRELDHVRVGFVDFDHADWPDRILTWESFDEFFTALRHYESL